MHITLHTHSEHAAKHDLLSAEHILASCHSEAKLPKFAADNAPKARSL